MQEGDNEDGGIARSVKEFFTGKSDDKSKVENAKGILSGSFLDEVYSMQYKNIGKCLIFNHMTFIPSGVEDRPYSELDARALRCFFESRGFDVKIYPDYKASQIRDILENESKNEQGYHKEASCFVCCVLTHGELVENQEYLWANDKKYPTERLFDPFAGNICDSLAGKPKMFFIQACRGDAYDPGVNVFYKISNFLENSFENSMFASECYQPPDNSTENISEPLLCCKIPVKADFLIAYSTVLKFISWKRNEEGSWFIQTLCKVLEEKADDSDLLSILTVVCRKVAYEYESALTREPNAEYKKQVPSSYSTLTKMMKFPPRTSMFAHVNHPVSYVVV